MCVLREQLDAEAAKRLEQKELGDAIRDLRLVAGPDALTDAELKSIYATEERRVADASVLAELLVPRLVASLPAAGATPRSPAPMPRPEPDAPVERPTTANPLGGVPDIPDLLDAMLSSERSAARRSSARHR